MTLDLERLRAETPGVASFHRLLAWEAVRPPPRLDDSPFGWAALNP